MLDAWPIETLQMTNMPSGKMRIAWRCFLLIAVQRKWNRRGIGQLATTGASQTTANARSSCIRLPFYFVYPHNQLWWRQSMSANKSIRCRLTRAKRIAVRGRPPRRMHAMKYGRSHIYAEACSRICVRESPLLEECARWPQPIALSGAIFKIQQFLVSFVHKLCTPRWRAAALWHSVKAFSIV